MPTILATPEIAKISNKKDKHEISKLNKTIRDVTDDIDKFRFNKEFYSIKPSKPFKLFLVVKCLLLVIYFFYLISSSSVWRGLLKQSII